MSTLGLNLSHDSSACLLDEHGNFVFCSQEERFSRRKNDTGFPHLALEYLFRNVAAPEKIHTVAIGDSCSADFVTDAFANLIYMGNLARKDQLLRNPLLLLQKAGPELALRPLLANKKNYRSLVKRLVHQGMPQAEVVFYNHHLSHAASAYYCSPYENALVVTLDGSGDNASGLTCVGSGHELTPRFQLPAGASVGDYYKSITAILDFMPGRHEGKITGLAALGCPKKYYSHFQKLLFLDSTGADPSIRSLCSERMLEKYKISSISYFFLLKNHLADYLKARDSGWYEFRRLGLQRFFRQLYRDVFGISIDAHLPLEQKADLAAACQAVMEDVVAAYIEHHLKKNGQKNLALAGGVFANVKLNQRILEKTSARNIYIHPGMGDEGLAAGAAKYHFHNKHRLKPKALLSCYLGATFPHAGNYLRENGIAHEKLPRPELIERIAAALMEEKIVGLYSSKTEYGPRALGNRTILMSPKRKELNDIVNKRLRRTEFMPFAPVVLEECFHEIFESHHAPAAQFATRFMTITLPVRPEWQNRIPAVVHVDGTARPQTISAEDNPFYYGILKEFQKKSGIGVLVNTSFNMHEEPIVNSPEDAIRSFKRGAIDILVLEDNWCEGGGP